MILMKAKNKIKKLLDERSITRYQFWQNTGLAQNTAYRLYDDPEYIPGKNVIEKIHEAYQWQPGEYIEVEDDKST